MQHRFPAQADYTPKYNRLYYHGGQKERVNTQLLSVVYNIGPDGFA
jgi:hypothetical protein